MVGEQIIVNFLITVTNQTKGVKIILPHGLSIYSMVTLPVGLGRTS